MPGKLLRAMLLQAFYSIRSERQLMERLEFDLLFRSFVGIGVDNAAWDHSTFSKNPERLLEGDIAAKPLSGVLAQVQVKRPLSNDRFSVDGPLIAVWASMKSFWSKSGSGEPPASARAEPRGGFPWAEPLQRDAASTIDPEARLHRKGPWRIQALLHGECLTENRNGFVVDACLTEAKGHAERPGYAVSQRIRKRIEEAFGWIKPVAGQERSRFRGRERVGWGLHLRSRRRTIWRGGRSSWLPRRESPGELPTDWPLADR